MQITSSDNEITGTADSDVLKGTRDGDRIFGLEGDDVLFGGQGEDIFLASNTGFFDRDLILDFNQHQDQVALHTSIDNFSVLDTNSSGVLDAHDERVDIVHGSTVIDFSDLYGRSHNSDTITFVGVSDLNSDNFLFNEAVVNTELA